MIYPAFVWVSVMIINFLSILFHIVYYNDYSRYGNEHIILYNNNFHFLNSDINSFWFYCYHVFDIIFRGYSYIVIGLFAYGWKTYSEKVYSIIINNIILIECSKDIIQKARNYIHIN